MRAEVVLHPNFFVPVLHVYVYTGHREGIVTDEAQVGNAHLPQ